MDFQINSLSSIRQIYQRTPQMQNSNLYFSQGLNIESKLSKHSPETTKKQKSNLNTLQSEKTTQRTYACSSPHGIPNPQNTFSSWGLRKDLTPTSSSKIGLERRENQGLNMPQIRIRQLEEEIKELRCIHREETQFQLQQHLNAMFDVKKMVDAKQYRRLGIYVEHEIQSIKAKLRQYLQKQEEAESNSVAVRSFLEEDAEFQILNSHFQDNIQEVGIENIRILPQVKKLLNQTQLSSKKLSWYLSKVPFDLPSKQACNNLASKIVEDFGCKSGPEAMEVILKKTTGSYAAKESESSGSSLSKIIQRHSLCIL